MVPGGHHHVALVLIAPPPGQLPTLIGVGRFARDRADRTSAELAVTVDDAWHGRERARSCSESLLRRHAVRASARSRPPSAPLTPPALRLTQYAGAVTEWNRDGLTIEMRLDLT